MDRPRLELAGGCACQHDWEHCVPKIARAAGPRISIMFRHNLAGFTPGEAVAEG